MNNIANQIYGAYLDESALKQAITNKQNEGLYLEFKQKKDRRIPELDSDDRKNFSEALSQFANSDGGVQIWGIETKRPKDYAFKLKPIKELDAFIDRLKSYLKDAVQPAADGVLIEPIYKNKRNKTGYVKILIPQSDKTPHRSMVTREYYKRNVQGKYRLEHFDLEDMFGRRQKPYLSISIKPKVDIETSQNTSSDQDYLPEAIFEIYLSNVGRAIGRDAMMIVWCPDERLMKVEYNQSTGMVNRIDDMHGNKPTFQINLQGSIFYPDVNTRIGEMKIKISKNLKPEESIVKWIIYADNMLKKEGAIQAFDKT